MFHATGFKFLFRDSVACFLFLAYHAPISTVLRWGDMAWIKQPDPPGTKRAILLRYINDDLKCVNIERVLDQAPFKGINSTMLQVLEIGSFVVHQKMQKGLSLQEAIDSIKRDLISTGVKNTQNADSKSVDNPDT